MRLRRGRARPFVKGLQIQLKPVKPAVRAHFLGENSPLRRHVLPRATENGSDHPNAMTYTGGLDKFSTGVINLEGLLRQQSLLPEISLKVYGRAPFSTFGILQALSYSLESTPTAADLRSRLAQLANITYDVWKSSATFRNVYFQAFFPKRRSVGLSTPSWNIFCQLHRADSDAPPSKTYFELPVNIFLFKEHCQIREEGLDLDALQIRLSFYLKPQSHEPKSIPVDNESKTKVRSDSVVDALQLFVDSLIQRVYVSIRGQIFASFDETMTAIEKRISAYLTSSPLRDLVDFTRIQITMSRGITSERVVHDRLLNADGTLKAAPADVRDTFLNRLAAETEPGSLDSNDIEGSNAPLRNFGGGVVWYPVSEALREKVGFPELHFGISSESGIALAARGSFSEAILDDFERTCEGTNGNGIGCFLSAATSLATKYPDILSAIESKTRRVDPIEGPNILGRPTIRLGFHARHGLLTGFIRSPTNLAFSLTGSSAKVEKLISWAVSFQLIHKEPIPESAAEISAEEEARQLTQIIETIVQTLCRDVKFGSYQEMCAFVAEGILRHLRFPSTGTSPKSIRFSARIQAELSGHFTVVAQKPKTIMRASHDIESPTVSGESIPESTQAVETTETPELAIEKAPSESRSAAPLVQPEVSTAVIGLDANDEDVDDPWETNAAEDDIAGAEGLDQHSVFSTDRVFIALGSNLGNRLENIERACLEIDGEPDMRVLRTSALYETAPMYVEDQASFLNGVCEIETTLSPIELLDKLQGIEKRLGRVKTIDKGPRNIDLDILLFRNMRLQTERLTIPHPLMKEREFVLRPLCDIPTARKRTIPTAWKTRVDRGAMMKELLRSLPDAEKPMYAVSPLAPHCPDIRVGDPSNKTHIMSILNMTPDSFSDGGDYQTMETERLAAFAKAQIAAGATIIDIGGQSSRPNAPDVSAEDEIARILPAIEAVKSLPEAASVAISVDTYRAAVAEAAIKAGAHIVNDVSAGLLDPEMLPTVARLGCTYIMMHMRGSPATMMSAENCTYPRGLLFTLARELYSRVDAAEKAGIRRWRIILDPGIGFSKSVAQNLEILRNFSTLRQPPTGSHAWLIGSSRKSFIGKVTGVEEPKDRGWGSAAAVTMAIQGGANIVRVHDAEEMNAVVKMADAVYRPARAGREPK